MNTSSSFALKVDKILKNSEEVWKTFWCRCVTIQWLKQRIRLDTKRCLIFANYMKSQRKFSLAEFRSTNCCWTKVKSCGNKARNLSRPRMDAMSGNTSSLTELLRRTIDVECSQFVNRKDVVSHHYDAKSHAFWSRQMCRKIERIWLENCNAFTAWYKAFATNSTKG